MSALTDYIETHFIDEEAPNSFLGKAYSSGFALWNDHATFVYSPPGGGLANPVLEQDPPLISGGTPGDVMKFHIFKQALPDRVYIQQKQTLMGEQGKKVATLIAQCCDDNAAKVFTDDDFVTLSHETSSLLVNTIYTAIDALNTYVPAP